jgi:AraC-like DNA-binding protein
MGAESCSVVIDVLGRGSLATVSTFAHGAAWDGDPDEEANTSPAVVATLTGLWHYRGRNGLVEADPSILVLAQGREAYRCAHPLGPTDVTLCVSFDGDYELPSRSGVPRAPVECLLRALHRARDPLRIDALALTLLADLHELPSKVPALRPPQRRAVERARHYLEHSGDRSVTLAELARAAYVSPFHLHRLFRAELGVSPHEYQTRMRIDRAGRLLADGCSVAEVALAVGYRSPGHFARVFRARTGLTPSEYGRTGRVQGLTLA